MDDAAPAGPAARPRPEPERPTLRFLVRGPVDGGTSTLIGRLVHGCGAGRDERPAAPRDGAHHAFRTPARSFVAIDVPGHERSARDMATGAFDADLAVLLVDAREGMLDQTRRHATIASLFGIRHVVLAVNRIDLVGHDQRVFEAVATAFRGFALTLDFHEVAAIPVSARFGDNVAARSGRTPWYAGPCLVEHLEGVEVDRAERPFRMPVRWIHHPDGKSRGIAGTIASGRIAKGDAIVVAETGRTATIARVLTPDGDVGEAAAGDAVTLTLSEPIDVARGDVLARPDSRPAVADSLGARLFWMGEEPPRPAHGYLLKIGTRTVPATIASLEHHVATGVAASATTLGLNDPGLGLNDIGLATIATAVPVAFDPYAADRTTGGLVLIDRVSDETVAAGMVVRGLRAATNVFRQDFSVTRTERARLKGHRPGVVWLTGLPSAGKSTIANGVEARLNRAGVHTAILDGDNLRHGLTKDLGFTPADRTENIRRVAEVARLMTDAGLVVLCSFISPLRAERALARATIPNGEFMEVFVDTPLATCVARDPKGLYRRALAGAIKDFTGVHQPYETPVEPDVVVGRDGETIEHAVAAVMKALEARGVLKPPASPRPPRGAG